MKRTSKMWEDEFNDRSNWEIMSLNESLGIAFVRFQLAPIYRMESLGPQGWKVESYFFNRNPQKDFFFPQFETKKSLLSRLAKGEFE